MPSTREDLTPSIEGKKGGSRKDYVSDLKEGVGLTTATLALGKLKQEDPWFLGQPRVHRRHCLKNRTNPTKLGTDVRL